MVFERWILLELPSFSMEIDWPFKATEQIVLVLASKKKCCLLVLVLGLMTKLVPLTEMTLLIGNKEEMKNGLLTKKPNDLFIPLD